MRAATLPARLTLTRWRGTSAELVKIGGELAGSVWPDPRGGWRWARFDRIGPGSKDTGKCRSKPEALAALKARFQADQLPQRAA